MSMSIIMKFHTANTHRERGRKIKCDLPFISMLLCWLCQNAELLYFNTKMRLTQIDFHWKMSFNESKLKVKYYSEFEVNNSFNDNGSIWQTNNTCASFRFHPKLLMLLGRCAPDQIRFSSAIWWCLCSQKRKTDAEALLTISNNN